MQGKPSWALFFFLLALESHNKKTYIHILCKIAYNPRQIIGSAFHIAHVVCQANQELATKVPGFLRHLEERKLPQPLAP